MGNISYFSVMVLFVQVAMVPFGDCELFTALVHMEGLLDLEVELLATLNSYITAEKLRYFDIAQPSYL